MLSATYDSNESKNSLASGRILNFSNNSLQEALDLAAAIIVMILFGCKIFFLLSVEFLPKLSNVT
jgi:hypothetical protein